MTWQTSYKDIELYRPHGYFRRTLGIKRAPSCATLRHRLDASAGQFDAVLKTVNVALLAKASSTPACTLHGHYYVPIDLDVSSFDNSGWHQEGVGRTYRGEDRGAPNFAYIGLGGHMLNCELRPGTQHCRKGMPELRRETCGFVARVNPPAPAWLRMDSGNEAVNGGGIRRKGGGWGEGRFASSMRRAKR